MSVISKPTRNSIAPQRWERDQWVLYSSHGHSAGMKYYPLEYLICLVWCQWGTEGGWTPHMPCSSCLQHLRAFTSPPFPKTTCGNKYSSASPHLPHRQCEKPTSCQEPILWLLFVSTSPFPESMPASHRYMWRSCDTCWSPSDPPNEQESQKRKGRGACPLSSLASIFKQGQIGIITHWESSWQETALESHYQLVANWAKCSLWCW